MKFDNAQIQDSKESSLALVEKYASDLMFCALVWHKDEVSEMLLDRQVDFIQTDWLLALKGYMEKRG